MTNKSFIQIQLENIQARGKFEEGLKAILEKYDVQDSVFSVNNGNVELTKGYFVQQAQYEDLSQAIREMNNNQALRIVENNTFIVGDIYNNLSDCDECEHVFNIEFLEDVY